MPTQFIAAGPVPEPESSANPPTSTIRWIEGRNVPAIIATLARGETRFVHFEDPALFADAGCCLQLCVMLRERRINILWSARMNDTFGGGRLRTMRMAGCRRIVAVVRDELLVIFQAEARFFGYAYVLRRADGTVLDSAAEPYTVAEREAVAERLPGVAAVQFELAVAYFNAGRYDAVAGPLGRAVALGFPDSDPCMELVACLKAVREHPGRIGGHFVPAGQGMPSPLALRNRRLLRDWLETGGAVPGTRLLRDPGTEAFPVF